MKDSYPYAVAQKTNHPPKGYLPNVDAIHFKWSEVFHFFDQNELDKLKEIALKVNPILEGPWYFDPLEE